MNQNTIDKLLKLPDGGYGEENSFNWNLYDDAGNLTIDYKSIFNEEDFETLISILADKSVWTEDPEIYQERLRQNGIHELHHAHCWRTLALYQKEEVVDLFLDIFALPTTEVDSDVHFSDIRNFFLLFSENERVMKKLFDIFSEQITNENENIQNSLSEFFDNLYGITNPQNQEIIENLWIDKLKEDVIEDDDDDGEYNDLIYGKATLNAVIICGLLSTKLAEKHYELIKELMEEDKIDEMFCGDLEDIEIKLGMRTERTEPRTLLLPNFIGGSGFGGGFGGGVEVSQKRQSSVPKAVKKKNKNKKKAAKVSKKKNRK